MITVFTPTLAVSIPSWWWMMHIPAMMFIFCFGACVGSFLNVVIYRLPAGMSVISPPSRCPTCGARLRFFRENLPILGWFMVRGRCRYCGARVSPQYMIIELLMALTFLGLYVLLFGIDPAIVDLGRLGGGHLAKIGGSWWVRNTIVIAWPAFVAFAFLVAGLVAMTLIDARTFTIPIQIPLFVTITAFIAWPLQALMPLRNTTQTWPVPGVGWTGLMISIGGMLGVLISYLLLRAGKLRYSFADYNTYLPKPEGASGEEAGVSTEGVTAFELLFAAPLVIGIVLGPLLGPIAGAIAVVASMFAIALLCKARGMKFGPDSQPDASEVLADYPHARREMLVELGFLLPCIVLMIVGGFIGHAIAGYPGHFLQAIGATLGGYLVGGGLVWGIRILGTLGFGREAMGLGDVHLLAAIGAVLGWSDPIIIFFLAPFFGLLWAVFSIPLASLFRKARRELPYGPHLALATLALVLWRPWINEGFATYMPNVPFPPPPGFVPTTWPPTLPASIQVPVRTPRAATKPAASHPAVAPASQSAAGHAASRP